MSAVSCGQRYSLRRTGFSLVEIMIVIVIIGLLAGMVTVNIRGRMIQAKQNIARGDVAKISEAIEHFYATYSRYPTNEEGLAILTQASERIPAPLLDGKLSDPWGKRYQYNCPGRSKPYDVTCYGEDGREGGEGANADIRSDALQQ